MSKIRILFLLLLSFSYSLRAEVDPALTQKVYARANTAILNLHAIDAASKREKYLGSGIAIKDSILATTCQLALAGNFLVINVNDESKVGSVIYHKDNLCLVKVEDINFRTVAFRPTESVKAGETIFILGNAKEFEKNIFPSTIVQINPQNPRQWQVSTLSADISEGGIFDKEGRLIGIVDQALPGEKNHINIIPTELISEVTHPAEPRSLEQKQIQKKITENLPNNKKSLLETEEKKLSLIRYYGKSQIGLFTWGNHYFISIPGRDIQGVPHSLLLWQMDFPHSFLLFPNTVDIASAIAIFDQYLKNKSFILTASSSYLLFNNTLYEFFGETNKRNAFSILITDTEINPTSYLLNTGYFSVQLRGRDNAPNLMTLQFDLSGFTEAFRQYKLLAHSMT